MDNTGKRSDGFAMAVVVESALAIVALLFAWFFHLPLREKLPQFGPPLLVAIGRGLLATLPMLAIFFWLMNSQLPALQKLREQVAWLVSEMFPAGNIGQFAMVAALAGIGEELLFRGALQLKIGDWTTPYIGLAITSLLFGLAHALSTLYFLFAVAVGAFLGWMVLRYNDLVAPMIAHGLYDFLALTYLAKSTARRDKNSAVPTAGKRSEDSPPRHDNSASH